ncbi:hypothetical protein LTI14_08070 [Nesterenkonia sp. YGD6]|uniref:tachylectin-related carbohydrate-binding protein n=1 Tax=Nesterenkonia sp. YGD6 TaxID=2901231 RepID=UPI001F4D2367|nr:tachylectin-related carbohydrate-binding protein [Nesterenkonia sp. YGD6]MCH8563167.1 hypothetical protein [Nesterenkonia sp. YGD6]
MPDLEGDEVYVTVAQMVPYVNYVVTAYKALEAIYNFGRESKVEKALRELDERLTRLEQFVTDLDERLSELEAKVAQGENRARVRTMREHQLSFSELGRDLTNRPQDAAVVAANALDRLRAMYRDNDLWLWSDAIKKPDDAPSSWRPAPTRFKGLPLPIFAYGAMIWVFSAQEAIRASGDRATYRKGADEVLTWVATRAEYVEYQTPPQSLAERFRHAVRVEIIISTRYVTPTGRCDYSFVAVNDIERTRKGLRGVSMHVGRPTTSTFCTADPRIAEGDEAILEDEFPQLMTLRMLEDAVTRIKTRGTLVDPFIGQFPNWTAHRLTLYGIRPNGDLHRFQLETTTALTDPPKVTPIGGVVGTGWHNFTEVHGTYDKIMYAFSGDRAVNWYRHDDVGRGPAGWSGPRRIRAPYEFPLLGEGQWHVNAGGGSFMLVRTFHDPRDFRIKRSLELIRHRDASNGTGSLGKSSMIVSQWRYYPKFFGGGEGVLYGIDESGDLFWHRHTSWPNPGTALEGPHKIGNGWNVFERVFALNSGFIAGIYPNGEMALYHFTQWRWGPRGAQPVWRGPIRVPGTQWRGFQTMIPMVGDAPVGGVN